MWGASLQQSANLLLRHCAADGLGCLVERSQALQRITLQVTTFFTPVAKGCQPIRIVRQRLSGFVLPLEFLQRFLNARQDIFNVAKHFKSKTVFPPRQVGFAHSSVPATPRFAAAPALRVSPRSELGSDFVERTRPVQVAGLGRRAIALANFVGFALQFHRQFQRLGL
ncbi:MAG TPA: hypothetical protein VGP72_02530 [Planctomycetota bacterium]